MKTKRKYTKAELYQDVTQGIVGGLSAANVAFAGFDFLDTQWMSGSGHLAIAAGVAVILVKDIRARAKSVTLHVPANDITVFGWAMGAADDFMKTAPDEFTDADRESLERLTKLAKAAGYEG